MATTDPNAATTTATTELPVPSSDGQQPEKVVKIRRRTIDVFLVWVGVVVMIVLLVAGGLLTWGNQFAEDYVSDELSAQNISFPPEEALIEEGRDDLAEYGGEQVTTGRQAEAYASYIAGHLDQIGGGATFADLGDPEGAARAAVAEATEAGAPQEEIDALQAELDAISNQRNSLFKGETLRGLLLSTYAWSTVGQIAGWAAIAAFVAAAVMLVLVVLGVVHLARNREAEAA